MSAELDTVAALRAIGSPNLAEMKIYPDEIEEGVPIPAIVYRRVSTEPVLVLFGSTGAAKVIMQLDCWGKTREEAEMVANQAQQAMIAAQHFPGERHGFEVAATGEHVAVLDFYVWEV